MPYRKEKIEVQIRKIISELLIKEIKDPRIGFMSISKVELSKDHSTAKVGVSVLGTKHEMRNSLAGINSAKGFIQHKLGKNLQIRIVPRVSFYLDTSLAESVEMVHLIETLNTEINEEEEDPNKKVTVDPELY